MKMIGQVRHVNRAGFITEVKVLYKKLDGDYWVRPTNGGNPFQVPECKFYHKTQPGDQLELRENPEFKHRYPDHPIEKEEAA